MNHIELMTMWEERLIGLDIRNKYFIEDGIVNNDIYKMMSKRILFILLEPYNLNKDSNFKSLIPYLSNGAHSKSKTWENGSKIVAKLINPKLSWQDLYAQNIIQSSSSTSFLSFKKEQLNKIAILNLKKEANIVSTCADSQLIGQHARLFSDLIKQQIDIINPDIIYCGGLDYSDIFLMALSEYLPTSSHWSQINKDKFYEIHLNKTRIIHSYHPCITSGIKDIFELF